VTAGFRKVGIAFTAVGAGVIIRGYTQGDTLFDQASLGFELTGLTFLILGPIFLLISRAIPTPNRRLLASGIDGSATITNAATTGWSINKDGRIVRLTLQVSVPGRSPYTVTKRELVAVWSLGTLVGQILPVKVDPDAPEKLELVWNASTEAGSTTIPGTGVTTTGDEFGQGSTVFVSRTDAAPWARAGSPIDPQPSGGADVPDNGDVSTSELAGRGTITAVTDTGVAIGGSRVYQLHLTVAAGARPTYPVTHTVLVPASALGRLQVGASVAIRVDPSDADRIFIEWDRA
jgi:hypothetical protein